MAKIADIKFSGASGTKHSFGAWPLNTSFKNIGAVYIFTKRTVTDGKGSHALLYIGETGELRDRIEGHEKWPCVEENGVNCICVHVEPDGDERLAIERDLIDGNATPCNG